MKGASKRRRPSNVEGNVFVDESCIDCDTCRWMAPDTFARDSKSYVHRQPVSDSERQAALAAMISCPTGSIRLEQPDPLAKQVRQSFPMAVDSSRISKVFHLGFHSAASFGATPYLFGDFSFSCMVDSPRFNSALANAIEAAGCVPTFMLLTHIDDVSDHQRWKDRWPSMKRVMHTADIRGPDAWPYTDLRGVEMQLDGEGPWELAPGLTAIHTPGHSRGSLCFLASGERTGGEGVLFSGDHLAYNAKLGRLDGFARYGWSLGLQAESMRKLADLPFTWVLPGHGRRWMFESDKQRAKTMLQAAEDFAVDPYGRQLVNSP